MKSAKVLISMPERFLDDIDKIAYRENRSRSELIREAVRMYMVKSKLRMPLHEERASYLEEILS